MGFQGGSLGLGLLTLGQPRTGSLQQPTGKAAENLCRRLLLEKGLSLHPLGLADRTCCTRAVHRSKSLSSVCPSCSTSQVPAVWGCLKDLL